MVARSSRSSSHDPNQLPLGRNLAAIEGAPYRPFPDRPLDRDDWVSDAPITNTSERFVLYRLARRANDRGIAYPSVSGLARETGYSRREVQYAIRALERQGWLTVAERTGRSSYYLPKSPAERHCRGCWKLLRADMDLCPKCGTEGVHVVHGGVHVVHPKRHRRGKETGKGKVRVGTG